MMFEHRCVQCSKKSYFYPSELVDGKGNEKRFCSKACADVGKANSLQFVRCTWCGERLKRRTRLFCSRECMTQSFRLAAKRRGVKAG
jgi:hypothetical protein